MTASTEPARSSGFDVMLGNPPTTDVIGIAVGHLYYFFEFVFHLDDYFLHRCKVGFRAYGINLATNFLANKTKLFSVRIDTA